ncbi:15621_t:CDS:2, partial [Acaulospora colombiana]
MNRVASNASASAGQQCRLVWLIEMDAARNAMRLAFSVLSASRRATTIHSRPPSFSGALSSPLRRVAIFSKFCQIRDFWILGYLFPIIEPECTPHRTPSSSLFCSLATHRTTIIGQHNGLTAKNSHSMLENPRTE